MTEHLAFHESFDSTRCTADDPAEHPNLTQGQIEAVVSLLLGRSLTVNNTYTLDSRTFLDLADVTLSTRAEVLDRTGDPGAREELLAARPFVLHRFKQPTLLTACADQFRRTRDRFGTGLFRLSAWSAINEDTKRRDQLADLLRRIENGDADRTAPAWLGEADPALVPRFDTLMRLDSYFGLPGADRDARVPTITEQGYVEHMLAAGDGDGARLRAVAERQGCPEELAYTLLDGIRQRAAQAGPEGVRRAWIHDVVADTDRADPALFGRQQLQEFQDTVYNATLADSAYAQFDYLSSTPRTDARVQLKQVNALAVGIVRDRLGQDRAVPEGAERAADRMSGLLAAASVLPHVPRNSLTSLFRAYWELQADEDRLPLWRASTRQLNQILGAPVLNEGRLWTAWAAHLRLLTEMLPHVVDADEVEIRVGTDHAGGYVHNLRLGPLDPAELNRSVSSGEHLAKTFLRDLGRAPH